MESKRSDAKDVDYYASTKHSSADDTSSVDSKSQKQASDYRDIKLADLEAELDAITEAEFQALIASPKTGCAFAVSTEPVAVNLVSGLKMYE